METASKGRNIPICRVADRLLLDRESHISAVENLLGQQLVGYPYNPALIDLAGLPTSLVVRLLDDGSWEVLP